MTSDDDALKAAAGHLIAAARSAIDAVEEVIEDPESLRRVMAVVSTVVAEASRKIGDAAQRSTETDEDL